MNLWQNAEKVDFQRFISKKGLHWSVKYVKFC